MTPWYVNILMDNKVAVVIKYDSVDAAMEGATAATQEFKPNGYTVVTNYPMKFDEVTD
jgi:hypothetical protein